MDACGRREFLRMVGAGGAACLLNGAGVLSLFGDEPEDLLRAATDWERLADDRVRCNICPFD